MRSDTFTEILEPVTGTVRTCLPRKLKICRLNPFSTRALNSKVIVVDAGLGKNRIFLTSSAAPDCGNVFCAKTTTDNKIKRAIREKCFK